MEGLNLGCVQNLILTAHNNVHFKVLGILFVLPAH